MKINFCQPVTFIAILIVFLSLGNRTDAKYIQSAEHPDLKTIKDRVISQLLNEEINEEHIETLMNTIQNDGSWPDINYEDFSRTAFEHYRHVGNLENLGLAYRKPSSPFHQSTELKQVIDDALDFWIEHDFIAQNWWTNEIGMPGTWADFLLLTGSELSKSQKEEILRMANRANPHSWGARPGGDRIKIAGIMAKIALFEVNREKLNKAVNIMEDEVGVSLNRGINPDLSFHHRNDRVTNVLSYGTGYAQAFAEWAARFRGTQFSFSKDINHLMVDYFLDGICQTMVYGKFPDPGAMNRGMSRPSALSPEGADLPKNLLKATNYREDELKTIVEIRQGKQQPDFTSNSFFWHSEYHSHQRADYFTSVRMYSDRNNNMEHPHNRESIKMHHYADGANFISRTGKEYYNIYPVFDWMKIPGTTVVQKPSLPEAGEIPKRGLTEFVGGVSDGRYGAAAFDFISPHDSLKAKKAWFMFDKEYVCLGTGIKSNAGNPVATTLNQSLLKSKVTVNKNENSTILDKGSHALKGIDWVLHDKIAYLFPDPTDLHLNNKEAVGSWYSINRQSDSPKDEIRKDVFKLWLDHGKKPQNGKYEYIVVPGIGDKEIASYTRNSGIEILANSSMVQAVKNENLNLTQVNFYEPGEISINENLTLTATTPGIVMMKTDEKNIEKITVADPTRKLKEFHLKVSSKFEGEGSNWKAMWDNEEKVSDIYIGLPGGVDAGKSAIVKKEAAFSGQPYQIEAFKEEKTTKDTTREKEKHFVGEKFGGGIVFYVDESGEHGLIAATSDQSDGIRWENGPADVTHAPGDHGDKVTNARRNGIGAGRMNTTLIISQQTVYNPFGDFAAKVCSSCESGGYGDWYLPSKVELNLMYQQRDKIGGFGDDLYWSSTEYNVGFAWGQNFHGYGGQQTLNKGSDSRVRCIRKF